MVRCMYAEIGEVIVGQILGSGPPVSSEYAVISNRAN